MRSVKITLLAALAVVTNVLAEVLPPWKSGMLDIHQIATYRGNSALIIGPDGTSIMIDAGAANGKPELTSRPMPNDSRRPGEWIARYAERQLRATGRVKLDYFVVTHLHPDHVGDAGPLNPRSTKGEYQLTGMTDVAEAIPIQVLIDRGFPDYNYPTRWSAPFALNYFAYVAARQKLGEACERLRVGEAKQIHLSYSPEKFPKFAVRNIAANGVIWDGEGEASRSVMPPLRDLAPADYPDENMCSIALRLSYGKFDYFTGGDLECYTYDGQQPWRDIETPVARVTGAVEVAVANHHGYFDAVGADSVRALQPMAWVVPAWHVTHPGIAQLERMLSTKLYPGPRDVFITNLTPAAAQLNQRFLSRVASVEGNVVVRVEPGGESFWVYITENSDELDTIKAKFGPYQCR